VSSIEPHRARSSYSTATASRGRLSSAPRGGICIRERKLLGSDYLRFRCYVRNDSHQQKEDAQPLPVHVPREGIEREGIESSAEFCSNRIEREKKILRSNRSVSDDGRSFPSSQEDVTRERRRSADDDTGQASNIAKRHE